MQSHIDILVAYFKRELPELKRTYAWKIPTLEGFGRCGEKGYVANVELKQWLHKQWLSCSKEDDKVNLARVIIRDWGGVKRNHEATLRAYVREIEKPNPRTPIVGVASYSKLFSIVNLEKYAIYDARVAACLNAVQWNGQGGKRVAFTYILGRNNTTGNATNKKGFVYQEAFTKARLIRAGWREIKRDETYAVYLATLNECLTQLPGYNLYDLEMVLFANAEKECAAAMQGCVASHSPQ